MGSPLHFQTVGREPFLLRCCSYTCFVWVHAHVVGPCWVFSQLTFVYRWFARNLFINSTLRGQLFHHFAYRVYHDKLLRVLSRSGCAIHARHWNPCATPQLRGSTSKTSYRPSQTGANLCRHSIITNYFFHKNAGESKFWLSLHRWCQLLEFFWYRFCCMFISLLKHSMIVLSHFLYLQR